MHPALVAFLLLGSIFVIWAGPILVKALVFFLELRQQGFSNQQIGEIMRSEGQRLQELGEAMERGCGERCHAKYCELDPLGEEPHKCHEIDCPGEES